MKKSGMPAITAISIGPIIVGVALALSSCSGIGYYAESISGQLTLLMRREPISVVLSGPHTPQHVRQKLHTILDIRAFAVTELGLPDNGSYLTFVNLDRRYVAWNVFATPEFSLQPLSWCFPVAGCFSYHGYFSEQKANLAAEHLAKQGHDVHIGGVAAYSTLGWFKDPVLSPMLNWRDTRIAEVIFHELAHQLIYISGDTAFNEAFATTTATNGVRHWLMKRGKIDTLANFDAEQKRQLEFASMVLRTTTRLRGLYASPIEPSAMRTEKNRIFRILEDEYQTLRAEWSGYSAYDSWIASGLNNAKISSVVTYHEHVKAFNTLFYAVAQHFPEFYWQVREIGRLSDRRRLACLRELSTGPIGSALSCPAKAHWRVVEAYNRRVTKHLTIPNTRT